MVNIVSELILDFHARNFPSLNRRNAVPPQVPGKIDVVAGMRRSGKTFFCYQTMQKLCADGLAAERILYVNFEDERLLPLTAADLCQIPDAYYRLYPEYQHQECWFFFDEMQRIEGWEMFCRRLLDTENIRLTLTGSSSRLLSTEIATSLRGRSLTTEIFPYDYGEFLDARGLAPDDPKRIGSAVRSRLEKAFLEYLLSGGFPEILGMRDDIAAQILQQYVDLVVFRDVVERYHVGNLIPLRYLLRQVLGSVGSRFSVSKFYNTLRSQGISCTKHALYEHLDQLTDAYLLYQVPIHSLSEKARLVNPRKIYAVDSGLVCKSAIYRREDYGALLENIVFMHLRRLGNQIEYIINDDGTEVDFLVTDREGGRELIQACWSLETPDILHREQRALTKAMFTLGITQATIVTAFDPIREITTEAGPVCVEPAWHWLLS